MGENLYGALIISTFNEYNTIDVLFRISYYVLLMVSLLCRSLAKKKLKKKMFGIGACSGNTINFRHVALNK